MPATHEREHVADPALRARGVRHDARLDGRLQPLRVAVGADRQRGARELQQAHQHRGVAGHFGFASAPLAPNSWMRPPWPDSLSWRWCAPYAPASGSKGASTACHARAQARQHLLEHVVGREAQPAVAHLHRHVAVAEVVGGARERLGRLARDVQDAARAAPPPRSRGRRRRRRRSPPRSTAPRGSATPTSSPESSRARCAALLAPVEGERRAGRFTVARGRRRAGRTGRRERISHHQKRK